MKKNRVYRFCMYLILLALLFFPSKLIYNSSASQSNHLTPNKLTSSLNVGVKSVLNEKSDGGYRIGLVIYMYNHGEKNVSVPDFELRAVTADRVTYVLKPSLNNMKTLQPKETIELSYFTEIKRKDSFTIDKVHFIAVDEYVYPKKETRLTTIWIAGKEWNGSGSQIHDPAKSIDWGKAFSLLELNADLIFTPLQYFPHSTSEGTDLIIAMQVHNNGNRKVKLPEFSIEGRSQIGIYEGKSLAQKEITFNAGEKKNIYFLISIPSGETLKRITVLTPEKHKVNDNTEIIYQVGRIQLVLPQTKWNTVSYNFGESIPIDTSYLSSISTIDVSVVELSRYKEEGSSNQIAIVKLQMINRSDRSLYVPKFDVELMTSEKVRYTGSKQTTSWETLQPNFNYVFEYAFRIPTSVSSDNISLNILDQPYGIPYSLPIASINTTLKKGGDSTGTIFDLYPYELQVKSWSITPQPTNGKLEFVVDLNIESEENVVVDSKSSRLTFELVDSSNQLVGAYAIKMDSSATSGKQKVLFDSANITNPVSVNVYASFDTAQGEIKRMIGKLK